MKLIISALMLSLTAGFQLSPVSDIYQNQQLQIALLSEHKGLQRDKVNWLGVHFELAEGWHIYWKNPGDNGVAPSIELSLPTGVVAGELNWPLPEKFVIAPYVDYGYRSALLMFPVTLAEVKGGEGEHVAIDAEVTWLACNEICLPGSAQLRLNLPVSTQTAPAYQHSLFSRARQFTPHSDEHIKASFVRDGADLVVTVARHTLPVDFVVESLTVYPLTAKVVDNTIDPVVQVGDLMLTVRYRLAAYFSDSLSRFDLVLAAAGHRPVLVQSANGEL